MRFKLLVFAILLNLTNAFSQEKVKFDKKSFKFYAIKYPKSACLDNVLTQSAFFQIADNIPVAEKNLKRDFFDLRGYLKQPETGELKTFVSIQPGTQRERESLKDSIFTIRLDIIVEVKCKSNTIFKKNYAFRHAIKYGEKLSNIQLQSGVSLVEMKNEFGDQIESAINNYIKTIGYQLNEILDFYTTREKEALFFLTSKEHPEYSNFIAFENEITTQFQAMTPILGLNKKALFPHLAFLESILIKYPASETNEKIRFLASFDLAQIYFLLENKERTLYFANEVIKNNFRPSWGRELIDKANNSYFEENKSRAHNTRFVDLKKLGYEEKMLELQEVEEGRIAYFEKIENDAKNYEIEKLERLKYIQLAQNRRNNMLDSLSKQNNAELLGKILQNYGGVQILKGVEKVHISSKLKYEETNIPVFDEKWCIAFSNYLLKKKRPDNYYVVVNQADAWQHDDRKAGEKWKTMTTAEYLNQSQNLDPFYIFSAINLDLWNKYELVADITMDGQNCYHFKYIEITINTNNRPIPKAEHHLYFNKENYRLIATETTEFDEGKKLSFERKIYQDYREQVSLNSGAIPYKIIYQIEDFYGETVFEETIEKIEFNPTFSNRIFVKEVYMGGFK